MTNAEVDSKSLGSSIALLIELKGHDKKLLTFQFRRCRVQVNPGGGGSPILGHIKDVRPEWMTFPGQKPADGCKFLTRNLRMGRNFDIILPGNGWFSSKLNKAHCSLVNFYYK